MGRWKPVARIALGLSVLLVGGGILAMQIHAASGNPPSSARGDDARSAPGGDSKEGHAAGPGDALPASGEDASAGLGGEAPLPAALAGTAQAVVLLLPGDSAPEGTAPVVRLHADGDLLIERPPPVAVGPTRAPWGEAALRVPSADPSEWDRVARDRLLTLCRRWTGSDVSRWRCGNPELLTRWQHLGRWVR